MIILSTILTLLILTSCSSINDCDNRFYFSNCDLDIPIVQLDYAKNFDSTRCEIQNQFKDDLSEWCSWVEFKIPFEFDCKKGYLKVLADFDYPFGKNCPDPIRLRYYYTIIININSQLIVNGELMQYDSLKSSILNYFNNVGNKEGFYPEKYDQVNFLLYWDRKTKSSSIEKVLTEISNAHLLFVEQKVTMNGFKFCNLTIRELDSLKSMYPIRIELDLGKIRRMAPPDIKQLNELERINPMEDNELIEIKNAETLTNAKTKWAYST